MCGLVDAALAAAGRIAASTVPRASQFIYWRIAQFADRTGVPLPRYKRPLYPRQPSAQRNLDLYMWAPQSPRATLKAPPGMNKGHIILDFDRRIIEH